MTPTVEIQLDDQLARQRIRTSLAESLLVEASAGTGKTTELVARIVSVLASGATTIDHIVAVTFTNKAAGELKLRLRQELDRARETVATPRERRNIENALEHLEEASIGTIHSFCAQILRERPVEAVVDPAFEELTEQQAARIFERAFRAWIQKKLAEGAPALRRALVRLAWRDSFDGGPPIDQLQYAAWKLIEWRDHPEPWRQVAFDRDHQIDQLIEQVKLIAEAASRCRKPTDNLVRSLRPAQAVHHLDRARRKAATRSRDYDTLESLLIKLLRDLKKDTKKGSGFFSSTVPREQVVGARAQLMENLETFQIAADADLAAMLRGEMWDLVESYDALKRRAGKLDFVDLLILARDLVRDNAEVRATCRTASRTSSSMNFKIPIRCKPRSCCCWPPMTRRNRTGFKLRRSPASCSLSAILSSRFTNFAAPTLCFTAPSATRCVTRRRRSSSSPPAFALCGPSSSASTPRSIPRCRTMQPPARPPIRR